MAEDDTDTQPAPPTHGRAIAGQGKKGGLLNGPHREMILVVCSVVGVGLAYLSLKGKGAGSTSSTASPGAATLTNGGALGNGQVAGFDQNAVYGFQTMLANQSDLLQGIEASLNTAPPTPTSTTTPIAAPTSNASWLSQAMTGWAASGGNAVDMQAALTQYENGQPINSAQESGVNWAIHNYGTAPEGTKGVSPIVGG